MQRLAALVPRPRLHLVRFGGRITSLREMSVVPLRARRAGTECEAAGQGGAHPPDEPAQKVQAQEDNEAKHGRPMRLGWAKLLKRVFNLDLEHRPNCGGELRVIAAILERPAIEKILNHLGLQARAPPRALARGQRTLQDI
jgi:hypothetical protein